MLKEIKELAADFGFIGLVFGMLSLIIRPAKPWLENVKEVVASVTLAIVIGLLLRDTGLSDTTIYGIIGGCSCFARTIFDGVGRLLTHVCEKPLFYMARILRLVRGRETDVCGKD